MLGVVPDINVLVSALINRRSPPGRIRAAWRRSELIFITSIPIITKASEVLYRPSVFEILSAASSKARAEAQINHLLHTLRHRARITPHQLDLRIIPEDPEEGHADFILSGDKHLTELGTYRGIPILPPDSAIIGRVLLLVRSDQFPHL